MERSGRIKMVKQGTKIRIAGAGMKIDNIISALPFIRSGRLRAIAISGAARSGSLPDVPTFQESGFRGLQTADARVYPVQGFACASAWARALRAGRAFA